MINKQKRRDFDALMGASTVIPIIMIGLVIFFISKAMVDAVIFTIIFLGVLGLLIHNVIPIRSISMEMIKRVFGIRVIEMKLVALAKFLKIDYLHVPEHYECMKEVKVKKV